jgi:hypothetical protein
MFHARSRFGAAAVLAAAACWMSAGCGGDDKDLSKFLGTWNISSGSLAASCPPLAVPTSPIGQGEQLVFTAGTDSDLVIERSGCKVKFDVSGNVASAKPGQSCAAMIANPLPMATGTVGVTLGINKASFTAAGTTGTYQQSGTAMLAIPLLSGCTYDVMASATKTP